MITSSVCGSWNQLDGYGPCVILCVFIYLLRRPKGYTKIWPDDQYARKYDHKLIIMPLHSEFWSPDEEPDRLEISSEGRSRKNPIRKRIFSSSKSATRGRFVVANREGERGNILQRKGEGKSTMRWPSVNARYLIKWWTLRYFLFVTQCWRYRSCID